MHRHHRLVPSNSFSLEASQSVDGFWNFVMSSRRDVHIPDESLSEKPDEGKGMEAFRNACLVEVGRIMLEAAPRVLVSLLLPVTQAQKFYF